MKKTTSFALWLVIVTGINIVLASGRQRDQEPTLDIQVNVNGSPMTTPSSSLRELAGLWGNELALKLEEIPKSRCSISPQGGKRFAPTAPTFPGTQRRGRGSQIALIDHPVTLEFKISNDRLTSVTMRIFSPFYQIKGTTDVWRQLTLATDTKKTRIECTQGLLEELRASTVRVSESSFQFQVKPSDGAIGSWVGELDGLGILRVSKGDLSTGVTLLDQVVMRRIHK